MSIDITNNIDVELDVLDVTQSKNNNSVSTPDQYVKVEEPEFPLKVTKKEYTIVGDQLYASITAEEAPTWLLGLIDEVVYSAVASGMVDYNLLTQDVRNAIDALDVASNTYVEQINIDATINSIITTRLATLNATLGNTYATKTELTTAAANADSALVQEINDLSVSFNDELSSRITSVQQAFANADSVIAEDINQLTATFDDQEANLSSAANAITGLQTYVGLSGSGVPDDTGLLSRVTTLEHQNDGVVEYITGSYDVMLNVSAEDANQDDDEIVVTAEPYATWLATDTANGDTAERTSHIGDVYIQYDSNGAYLRSFKFIKTAQDTTVPFATDSEGFTWALITDTDSSSAFLIASQARDLADGKRRVFLAEPFGPYDAGDLWVDSSGTPQIVKVSTVTRGSGYVAGDWVQADQQAQDFITNTYTDDKASIDRQLDGKIEYFFYESYEDITGVADEAAALTYIKSAWNTQALREANHGSVVYFKDSENAYWYQSSTSSWLTILDTSIYQALQKAAVAQASADGKVSQFYAWYDADNATPANFNILGADGTTVIDTVVASNFKYWYKTDGKLYYYTGTAWEEYPSVSEGDLLSAFNIDSRDTTVYTYNGTSWQQSSPTGIISKSKFFVDLENEVTGPGGHVATSLSTLQTTSEAYANNVGAGVENKFAYNSEVILNGQYYTSGFGLNSTGVTQPVGADGTPGNAFSSEFWINAEKFKFTNSNSTGSTAPFTIDASGTSPQITFNGKVNFTNVTNPPAIPTNTSDLTNDSDYTTSTSVSDNLVASIGAVPAYGSSVASNLSYDSSEQAIKLFSSSDNTIGLAFPAFKVNTTLNEKVNLSLSYKSIVANSSGLYIRIYEYDSDLPDGKTHVSDQSFASSSVVQEDTRQNSSWKENDAVTNSWVTTAYEYTPTATAKWASVVVLNWTGIGTNPLYIKGYSKTTLGADVDTSALALKDMSNVTTIDGGKIVTGSLSALSANLGNVTSGTLRNNTANYIPDANAAPSGSEQGAFIDLNAGKFVFGNASEYILFDGSNLTIKGTLDANDIQGDVITIQPFAVDGISISNTLETTVAEIIMPAAEHPDGHTPNAIVTGEFSFSGTNGDGIIRIYMKSSQGLNTNLGIPSAVYNSDLKPSLPIRSLEYTGDITDNVSYGENATQGSHTGTVTGVSYNSSTNTTTISLNSTSNWTTTADVIVGLAADTYYKVAEVRNGRTGTSNEGRPFAVQGSLGKSLGGDITLKLTAQATADTMTVRNTNGTLMGLR